MSTVEAVPNPSPRPKHCITLTRGAAYLLEGILQNKDLPATTNSQVTKACKLRRKLRTENPAEMGAHKFEKPTVRGKDESDIDAANRTVAATEAFETWQHQSFVVEVTDKQRDTARHAIEWGLRSRDKGVLPQNNDHLLSLLEGFGLDEDSGE